MSLEWRLQKIYTPEEQEERAAKALALNGITVEPETEMLLQLRAASKKKPTVRVNRLAYQPRPKLKAAASPLQQAKLKAAAATSPSVQIAAILPSHEMSRGDIVQPPNPDQTTLVVKTSCLGCGAKATQVLHFQAGKEMRPSKNPQILPKLCQACKGDMYCEYSGSALH